MRATGVLVACLFVTECGGGPTAPTSQPTVPPIGLPPSASAYDGVWTGQTDQGRSATFTVAGNNITNFNFNYVLDNAESSCSVTGGFVGSGSFATIANDTFLIAAPGKPDGSLTWTVSGLFTSLTNATGTLEVRFTALGPDSRPPCAASVKTAWTAGKS